MAPAHERVPQEGAEPAEAAPKELSSQAVKTTEGAEAVPKDSSSRTVETMEASQAVLATQDSSSRAVEAEKAAEAVTKESSSRAVEPPGPSVPVGACGAESGAGDGTACDKTVPAALSTGARKMATHMKTQTRMEDTVQM